MITHRLFIDKFNNLPQWFHDGLKSSLNEAKQSNPPITRIYFDLDGVLAGFDEQFTKQILQVMFRLIFRREEKN